MKINYLNYSSLDNLKSDIGVNAKKDYYKKTSPWLEEYFDKKKYMLQSKFEMDNIKLIISESPRKHFDAENAITIHKALDLTITQAIDERMWAYLTHVNFWEYMQARWDISNLRNPVTVIRERYFFSGGDRRFTRNGIARLWWAAEISKDVNRDDPYELTKILFTTQDMAQNLLERSFSRNVNLTRAILAVFSEMDKEIYTNVKKYRDLMKYFNSLGGFTLLDSLDKESLKEIIHEKMGLTVIR